MALAGSSIRIDDQLRWLEQEIEIARDQKYKLTDSLDKRIVKTTAIEGKSEALIRKSSLKLKALFIESLILLEAKQFADSITHIKAKRPVAPITRGHSQEQAT